MVVIVDIHFGNGMVMVFRNPADDFGDGVEVVFDVVLHDDMVTDVVLWVVVFQFLYTCKKNVIFS